MEETILNVNKENFPPVMFHFKYSLRPFIKVFDGRGDVQFVDLDNFEVMSFEEVEWEMLFYDNPDNPDEENFYGVAVIGEFRV